MKRSDAASFFSTFPGCPRRRSRFPRLVGTPTIACSEYRSAVSPFCANWDNERADLKNQGAKASFRSGQSIAILACVLEGARHGIQTIQPLVPISGSWSTRRDEKRRRLEMIRTWMTGPILPTKEIIPALEALIVSGDRIVLEGDNQKQADFLSRSLVEVDPKKIHDLHLVISSIMPAGASHLV